jgi:hypothetical protein
MVPSAALVTEGYTRKYYVTDSGTLPVLEGLKIVKHIMFVLMVLQPGNHQHQFELLTLFISIHPMCYYAKLIFSRCCNGIMEMFIKDE